MEERRKFVRMDVCIKVDYEILPMVSGQAESKNISEGGLCFLTEKILENNIVLLLKFDLSDPEKTHIECTGKVMWQKIDDKGYLTGVEFLGKDFWGQMKIQKFVSDYLRKLENNAAISIP